MATHPGVRRAVPLALPALLLAGLGADGWVGHRDPGPPSAASLRAVGTAVEPASAWPQAGHDARRGSAVRAGVLGPTSGRQRWHRKLEGPVSAGPVIGVDGSVLIGSSAGRLHALDPATGKDRWTFDGSGGYGSDLSTSAAVLADGTILWPGPQNSLWAVDRRGRLLWREKFAGPVLSPAVAGNGQVYVADMAGSVVSLRIDGTGHSVRWRYHLDGVSYSSPAVSPTGTIVVGADGELVGLQDLGDRARTAWRWPTPATLEVSAGVAPDGTSVVGLNDRWVYGIDDLGRRVWRFRKDRWSYSSATVTADGRAWVGDHDGELNVLDSASGRALRILPTRPPEPISTGPGIWTSPAVDSVGQSYVGTRPGHVLGFDRDGRRLFDTRVGGTVSSYPALGADGTLYIGSLDGVLHAFADR